MKINKIKLLILITVFLLSLSSCGSETVSINVNVENAEELNNTVLGKDALIEIGNGLLYDSATRIVYLKIDGVDGYSYFSAYYAPNGLPYRYNPETNTFEEIGEN